MKREILMSTTTEETRVAILEDEVLVELMVERPDSTRIVGDLYLGRVEAVLPGIQAAFVDIGTEKAAFLHVSDVATDEDDDEPSDEAGDDTASSEANGGNGSNGSRRRSRRCGATAGRHRASRRCRCCEH